MGNLNLVKKAMQVVSGGDLVNFLPSPMATKVIEYIRDLTIVRGLFKEVFMPGRTYKMPKRTSGMSAYHALDGAEAEQTSFQSGAITLTAKKLFAQSIVDEESFEDVGVNDPGLLELILQDFAGAMAEAEEYAFLQGDTTHTATAITADTATAANWFRFDPRVMFDGIFTIADGSADAADEVACGAADLTPTFINKALFNIGKYGRNKAMVKCLINSTAAANLRIDATLKDASMTGLMLSSYITGLGNVAVTNGLVTNLFGVDIYEAPFAPAAQGVVFHKDSPVIGDRRLIKVKSEEIIKSDQRRYVVSERIAFENQWDESLSLLADLSVVVST